MNPTTNTGGSDGDRASPVPNTDVMMLGSDPAVRRAFRTANRRSSRRAGPVDAGRNERHQLRPHRHRQFHQRHFQRKLTLTITYLYHQSASETFGSATQSLSYDQSGTMVIVATALGTYSVSGGVTSLAGHYSDSQIDTGGALLVDTSMTAGSGPANIGASNSFLAETDTENDNYVEAGTLSAGGTSPAPRPTTRPRPPITPRLPRRPASPPARPLLPMPAIPARDADLFRARHV